MIGDHWLYRFYKRKLIYLSRFIIPQLLCIWQHDIFLIYQVLLQRHQFQNNPEPTQPKGENKATNICKKLLQKKLK